MVRQILLLLFFCEKEEKNMGSLKYIETERTKEYKNTKEKLVQQLKDIFVANYICYQRGNQIISTCTWTKGVDSYLPKTQYIHLVDTTRGGGGSFFMIPVQKLLSQFPNSMQVVPGVEPIYYQTKEFPFLNASNLQKIL